MFPQTFLRGEQTARPPSSSYINIIVQTLQITHYMMDAMGLLSWGTFSESKCGFVFNRKLKITVLWVLWFYQHSTHGFKR